MDTDSNKITWVVVIVAAVAIMGGLFVKFVPNSTSQIQVYAQTVIGNVRHSSDTAASNSSSDTAASNSSSDTVDSSSNSDFSYSDLNTANDTISVTGYNGDLTNVVIPAYRKIGSVNYKVTSIGDYAFNHENIEKVTIPDTVASIGKCAFNENHSIEHVTIPDSVQTIGYEAFSGTHNLKSLTLGSSVTTIGDGAFDHTLLTSVDFPASVKSIGDWAFYDGQISSISFKSPVKLGQITFKSNKMTHVTLPKGSTYVGSTFDSGVTATIQ